MATTAQTTTVYKLHNMYQIKRAAENADSGWFYPPILGFFSSRFSRRVYPVPNGALFISSDLARPFRGDDGPRLYSVRSCTCDGRIDTVGEFQQYRTREAAHNAAAKMQREGFSLV